MTRTIMMTIVIQIKTEKKLHPHPIFFFLIVIFSRYREWGAIALLLLLLLLLLNQTGGLTYLLRSFGNRLVD